MMVPPSWIAALFQELTPQPCEGPVVVQHQPLGQDIPGEGSANRSYCAPGGGGVVNGFPMEENPGKANLTLLMAGEEMWGPLSTRRAAGLSNPR